MYIDLGCGASKREGFLGIDRFPLPGVDLVADLNEGIPLPDDSVDFVYASHSLEHLESTDQVFNELYRVCKHGAIVTILAPYYIQTLNVSNFYHKTSYTEDTIRFLTSHETQRAPALDWQYSQQPCFALSKSDHSSSVLEFELLYIEFFYYEPYRKLTEKERLYARKSFWNVCDQFYVALVVNKSGAPLSPNALSEYEKHARNNEPERLKTLRLRDSVSDEGASNNIPSVFDIIADARKASMTYCNDKLSSELSTVKNELATVKEQFVRELQQTQSIWEQRYRSLLAHYIEQCATTNPRWSRQKTRGMFRKTPALFDNIRSVYPSFFERLWLNHPKVRKRTGFRLSSFLPYASYHEYLINGYGNYLHLFLVSVPGSNLYVEIVQNGIITDGIQLQTTGDGPVIVPLSKSISGDAYCRLKVLDNTGIVRVLELQRRSSYLMSRFYLAAFVDEDQEV